MADAAAHWLSAATSLLGKHRSVSDYSDVRPRKRARAPLSELATVHQPKTAAVALPPLTTQKQLAPVVAHLLPRSPRVPAPGPGQIEIQDPPYALDLEALLSSPATSPLTDQWSSDAYPRIEAGTLFTELEALEHSLATLLAARGAGLPCAHCSRHWQHLVILPRPIREQLRHRDLVAVPDLDGYTDETVEEALAWDGVTPDLAARLALGMRQVKVELESLWWDAMIAYRLDAPEGLAW